MILDLSVLVDGTTQGPPAAGSPPVVLETRFRGPGHWESSRIAALLHTGLHVDAPLHVVADGKAIDAVALDEVSGTAVLIGVHDAGEPRRPNDVEDDPHDGSAAEQFVLVFVMANFRRLAPLVTGAQGVVYDTALRGVHHQELLRSLGLLPINRVAAAARGARTPRRKDGRRVAKSVHVEDRMVTGPDGRAISVSLYAQDGAIGIGRLTDRSQMVFEALRRIRTHRTRDKSRMYRWYNDYRLPQRLGGGTVTVRLHANDQDRTKRFNRTENVRPIPPSDPDFARLYARRNDAESINRSLEDTLFLGRAHSVGRLRQQVDLIGYALLVNGLTVLRHERRGRLPTAA